MTGFGFSDGDDVRVKGDDGTDDGKLIGAIGDALKTTAEFTDASLQDAFGRLRVSIPTIKFAVYFVENDGPIKMTKKEVTGGTVTRDTTKKEMLLAVTTSSGSRAAYQSKEYVHYIPGQSTAVEVSARMDAGTSGCIQRVGLFDDDNGLYFELDGTSLYTVIRSKVSGSVVETRTLQASWSEDPINGAGSSGKTLDITKQQIFYIDYQWLGAGRIRFGFNIDGEIIIVDQRYHANSSSQLYMQTGSLPVRCEIVNSSAIGSSKTMRWACASVYNEGSIDTALNQHSVNRGTDDINVNGVEFKPLISIRLKSQYKRATIVPQSFSLLSTSNTDVFWEVTLNPTLSGTVTWVSAGTNSIAEYTITPTGATGGEIIGSGYISKQSNVSPRVEQSALKLVADFDGNVDILSLRAKTLTSNADLLAAINFLELF